LQSSNVVIYLLPSSYCKITKTIGPRSLGRARTCTKNSVSTYIFIERKRKSLPDSSQILTDKTRFSAEGIKCLFNVVDQKCHNNFKKCANNSNQIILGTYLCKMSLITSNDYSYILVLIIYVLS